MLSGGGFSDSLGFGFVSFCSILRISVSISLFISLQARFTSNKERQSFLSISGSFLESTNYDDPDDNDLEYEIFNSFTYGIGLHTEVKVYEFDSNNMYYGGTTNGYFSIKFETGYNKILKFEDKYAVGDTPYFICALVLGFGQF